MKKLLTFICFAFSFFYAFSVAADEKLDEALDLRYHNEVFSVLEGKNLRLEFFGKVGTFNIFSKSKKGSETPVLAMSDLFSTTGFLIKTDEKEFDLLKSKSVQKEGRRTENGVLMNYRLQNRIRFVADFSLISTVHNEGEDIIKVKLHLLNESLTPHKVALRGIFETVCGESSSIHFKTEKGLRIRNETRFTGEEMHAERAILSSNGSTSCQFVFDGLDTTPVSFITLGNIDELHHMPWDSGFRKGRGFSNIRGYDDSGIMIDWPELFLNSGDKVQFVFYIALASDEAYPRGIQFVDGMITPSDDEIKSEEESSEPLSEPISENPEKRTDVDFVFTPIKDYQLDPEYIQQLIDRIDSLQSSKDVNREEIKHLNAELDAILEKLRRR